MSSNIDYFFGENRKRLYGKFIGIDQDVLDYIGYLEDLLKERHQDIAELMDRHKAYHKKANQLFKKLDIPDIEYQKKCDEEDRRQKEEDFKRHERELDQFEKENQVWW